MTRPLAISSKLSTIPVLSFIGEKFGETSLDLKTTPLDTSCAVFYQGVIKYLQNIKINKKKKRLEILTAAASITVNTIVVEEFEEIAPPPE